MSFDTINIVEIGADLGKNSHRNLLVSSNLYSIFIVAVEKELFIYDLNVLNKSAAPNTTISPIKYTFHAKISWISMSPLETYFILCFENENELIVYQTQTIFKEECRQCHRKISMKIDGLVDILWDSNDISLYVVTQRNAPVMYLPEKNILRTLFIDQVPNRHIVSASMSQHEGAFALAYSDNKIELYKNNDTKKIMEYPLSKKEILNESSVKKIILQSPCFLIILYHSIDSANIYVYNIQTKLVICDIPFPNHDIRLHSTTFYSICRIGDSCMISSSSSYSHVLLLCGFSSCKNQVYNTPDTPSVPNSSLRVYNNAYNTFAPQKQTEKSNVIDKITYGFLTTSSNLLINALDLEFIPHSLPSFSVYQIITHRDKRFYIYPHAEEDIKFKSFISNNSANRNLLEKAVDLSDESYDKKTKVEHSKINWDEIYPIDKDSSVLTLSEETLGSQFKNTHFEATETNKGISSRDSAFLEMVQELNHRIHLLTKNNVFFKNSYEDKHLKILYQAINDSIELLNKITAKIDNLEMGISEISETSRTFEVIIKKFTERVNEIMNSNHESTEKTGLSAFSKHWHYYLKCTYDCLNAKIDFMKINSKPAKFWDKPVDQTLKLIATIQDENAAILKELTRLLATPSLKIDKFKVNYREDINSTMYPEIQDYADRESMSSTFSNLKSFLSDLEEYSFMRKNSHENINSSYVTNDNIKLIQLHEPTLFFSPKNLEEKLISQFNAAMKIDLSSANSPYIMDLPMVDDD